MEHMSKFGGGEQGPPGQGQPGMFGGYGGGYGMPSPGMMGMPGMPSMGGGGYNVSCVRQSRLDPARALIRSHTSPPTTPTPNTKRCSRRSTPTNTR